jgi:hypothetical protein
MANRLFLEKSKLVEKIALKFNIKSHETSQNERNSIKSMTEKADDDYRLLINKITFFYVMMTSLIMKNVNAKNV